MNGETGSGRRTLDDTSTIHEFPPHLRLAALNLRITSNSPNIISISTLHLGSYRKLIMPFRFRGERNASSGMGVGDHCKGTILELQSKKVHHNVIFKIDEKKNVVVEKIGNLAESFEDFTLALLENDCRYVVFDFANS